MPTHYNVLIIGAGTAGIMTAAQLVKKNATISIAIIDDAQKHYYQPAFTLVGAGTYNFEKTFCLTERVIPPSVTWIKESVESIQPSENHIITKQKQRVDYDVLVITCGLVNDLSLIEGLEDAVNQQVVCSNYIDPRITWEQLQNFNGGEAIFTQPSTPIKCGGAPQKAMYLACDYFRKKKISSKTKVSYFTPGSVIFGVPIIAQTLMKVIERYSINCNFQHNLIKIDPIQRIAYFENLQAKNSDNRIIEKKFQFLHLAPPQRVPDLLRNSDLLNVSGWLDVHIHKLQHYRYPNIFGIGDVAGLPTAKTGAAVRKQAPVVVENILHVLKNQPVSNADYDGYSSCPLVTGYGKMVLAEFNYKNEFIPDSKLKWMGIKDSHKEHWRLWILKKYILPFLYWHKMLKGENG